MKKTVVFVSGPQRGGKSFLCNELKQHGIEVLDVDDFTTHHPEGKTLRFDGSETTIRRAVFDMRDAILKSKSSVLVLCGVSVVYCRQENCPRDLATEVIRVLPDTIHFKKYYLNTSVKRLYLNMLATRARNSPTPEAARELFHQVLEVKEEATPEEVETAFNNWYTRVMSNQALGRGLKTHLATHLVFGYVPLDIETTEKRDAFVQRVLSFSTAKKKKPTLTRRASATKQTGRVVEEEESKQPLRRPPLLRRTRSVE